MNQNCPACGNPVVQGSGNLNCDFLIIEEFPELCLPEPPKTGWMKSREDWTSRKILIAELAKVGMVIQQFRIVSVYPHTVDADKKKRVLDPNCQQFGLEQVVSEILDRKGVIIFGKELCKEFTGYTLKQVQGLSGVNSQYIPDGDVPRFFAEPLRTILNPKNPGVGEFRIGLERFVSQL